MYIKLTHNNWSYLDELTSLSFFVKHAKWEEKNSGYVREILPQLINQKLSSKNIIIGADLSNTYVVISDGGVICIQN